MRSQIGRQKLPVDREKVRMLVGEIGYTEAAKRTGIARNTLYQWNYRYKWSILPADLRSVRNVTTCPTRVPSVATVHHQCGARSLACAQELEPTSGVLTDTPSRVLTKDVFPRSSSKMSLQS
jgi:transposase-like protein